MGLLYGNSAFVLPRSRQDPGSWKLPTTPLNCHHFPQSFFFSPFLSLSHQDPEGLPFFLFVRPFLLLVI